MIKTFTSRPKTIL